MSKRIIGLFCVLGFASGLWAQTSSSSINGRVTDPSGSAIVGARVRATNVATNVSREALSAESGSYTIPLLQVGDYTVEVEAKGFKALQRKNVVLQTATNQDLDFVLQIGDVSELVNVEASAPLLETEVHALGTVIENKKIVELPLNSREFYSLAYLMPGVMPPAQSSTLGYRGGFNVSGSSETSNNFMINGIDNNNDSINAPSFRPSVDSIQEFKVQTGMYSAEYGRSSGGQVVVTTKSGTNAFHGSAFEFLRNQVLDARNIFTLSSTNPVFKRNQFGGTIGGPVIKNKTFFFVSYEGLRLRQEVDAIGTTPTTAMVSGDFRSLLNLKTPIHVLNPFTGAEFPTPNVIPQNLIDPIGKAIAAYFPAPTIATALGAVPSSNYNFNQLRTESLNQYSLRIDHSLGAKDSLYGTLNYFDDPTFEPSNTTCGARVLPGFGCNSGLTTWLAGIVETHIFTPTLLNEARIGLNRYRQTRLPPDGTVDFIGQNHIQGVQPAGDPGFYGIPQTTVKGYSTLGINQNIPQDLVTNKFQWVDTVIWVRSAHTIKVGVDIRRSQGNDLSAQSGRGIFAFNADAKTATSGYALADLLLGVATSSSRNATAPKIYERTSSYNTYIQDDWKIRPNLILNLGARYELNTPFVVKNNQLSNFDMVTGQIYVAGTNGSGPNVYQYDKNNIEPRVGLAWTPIKNTVFRAGYGIYDNSATAYNGIGSIYFNPPFRNPQTFTPTDKVTLVTFSNPFPTALAKGSTTVTAVAKNFADAYIQQWGGGIQRTISANMLIDVAYAGSKGTRLPNELNINQPVPKGVRPYPSFGNISWFESNGNSTFHSLQTKLEKRYSAGISFLGSYTYSKSIDDTPGFASNSSASSAFPQNSRNRAVERGLSDFDIRHRFVASSVYELPFGPGKHMLEKGLGSELLRNWQLSGILSLMSGRPLTPYYTTDISQTLNNHDRPNVVGDPNNGPKTVQQWFNTAAFATPATGTFGNAGRNIINGPRFTNLDLAVSRRFTFTERVALQFRAEFFNSLNHTNFNLPLATVDGAGFGSIPSTFDQRQLQFALKLTF